MSWKQYGGQGKGSDGSRLNLEKYGEGMDRVADSPKPKNCGFCKSFISYDPIGNVKCKKGIKRNTNDKKIVECKEWEQ
jgi:hypothetical protein